MQLHRFACRLALSALALGATLSIGAPSRAAIVEAFEAGIWSGGADVDKDGYIFDCHLSGRYDPGNLAVYLRWDADGFHVTLEGDRFDLTPGERFEGRVRVGRQFTRDVPGRVLTPKLIDYNFGFDAEAREAVAAGLRMEVDGPAGSIEFPLNGTRVAINALMRCAAIYFPDDASTAPYPLPGAQVVERWRTVNNAAALRDAAPPAVLEKGSGAKKLRLRQTR